MTPLLTRTLTLAILAIYAAGMFALFERIHVIVAIGFTVIAVLPVGLVLVGNAKQHHGGTY